MMWHLIEVWLLVLLTFLVGCLGGAHLYGYLAQTRFANSQGAVADAIGDVLDRLKARIGLAPAWRPVHLRRVERTFSVSPGPVVDIDSPTALAGPRGTVDAAPAEEPYERDEVAVPLPPPRPMRRLPEPLRIADAAPIAPERVPPQRALAAPVAAQRPAGLAAPRGGVPDNLQRIKGIGRRNERLLNDLGIFHFGQIAAWTPAEAAWIGQYLAFPDRIARDDWVGQATLLAMGSGTGFQKSAERRRERRRQQREFQDRMANASAGVEGPEEDEDTFDEIDFPAIDNESGYDEYGADHASFDHDGPVEEAVLIDPDDDDLDSDSDEETR